MESILDQLTVLINQKISNPSSAANIIISIVNQAIFFESSQKLRYRSVVVVGVVVVYSDTITAIPAVSVRPPLSVTVALNDNAVPEAKSGYRDSMI